MTETDNYPHFRTDHLRNEWELFTGRDSGYHSGACTKDQTTPSEPRSRRKDRITLGTATIDLKTGELVQ